MNWIIEFRGNLSEESPLNMDGSTSMRAVSLVLGSDLPEALTNLLSYTKARGIAPTVVVRCEDLSTFTPTMEEAYTQEAINKALKQVNPNLPVYFTYAISSEAADDETVETDDIKYKMWSGSHDGQSGLLIKQNLHIASLKI